MNYSTLKNLINTAYGDYALRVPFDANNDPLNAYVKYIENDICETNKLYETFRKENEKMFKIGDFARVSVHCDAYGGYLNRGIGVIATRPIRIEDGVVKYGLQMVNRIPNPHGKNGLYYIKAGYLDSVNSSESLVEGRFNPSSVVGIDRVIYNDPATIVLWEDGTKTVVKCCDGDVFDPEKGLAMAIAKKALGNKPRYYDIFKKHLPKDCSGKNDQSRSSEIRIDIGNSEIHSDTSDAIRCSFYIFLHFPDGTMTKLRMGMALSDLLSTNREDLKKFDFMYVFIKEPHGKERCANANLSDDIYYDVIEEARKHFNRAYDAENIFGGNK